MPTLADLVQLLMADGELDDADLARIAEATIRERERIVTEKSWRERAHVHEKAHASVVTTDRAGVETVDASAVVCCDCRRALISDKGSVRILVCPQLHGRRPPELLPGKPDGAVECGDAPH